MQELTAEDQLLIDQSTALIVRMYRRGRHHIAAAVESADGRIFVAVNLGTNVGNTSICAEACAIAKAVSEGAEDLKRIVAVKYFPTDKRAKVVSPCGACRELLTDYGDPEVIFSIDNVIHKAPAHELLPGKYDE